MPVQHENLEDKIAKLPVWARQHIRRLEERFAPFAEELANMRKEVEVAKKRALRFQDANSALMEILSCAGRGGSALGAVIVSTLECYEIFREPHKVDHAGQTQTEP